MKNILVHLSLILRHLKSFTDFMVMYSMGGCDSAELIMPAVVLCSVRRSALSQVAAGIAAGI